MIKYFQIADRTMIFEDNSIEMHVSAWKSGALLQRFLASPAQYEKALTQAKTMGKELTLEQWQAIR